MLRDLSITEFTKVLGEGKATPGGGSAAALSASLAASLTSMVFNLTIDKKVSKDYPEYVISMMKDARLKTDTFRERYLELMAEDAKAFDSLMEAFTSKGDRTGKAEKEKDDRCGQSQGPGDSDEPSE